MSGDLTRVTSAIKDFVATKECTRCCTNRAAEEFGVDSKRKDGLSSVCKACRKARTKVYQGAKSQDRTFRSRGVFDFDTDLSVTKSSSRSRQIQPINPTEVAYIAGIIDGEGCITISRKKDSKGMKRGCCYRLSISVSNTSMAMLEWLHKKTGLGAINSKTRPSKKHKVSWRWSLWSMQANQLLSEIRPYLVVKGRQADLGMEFMSAKRDGVGSRGLSDAEWENQVRIYSEIRFLNRRGVA